ncbi:MAG: hypothetical protein QXW48_01490, partial [Thermoplasmata archaeon]
MILLIYFTTHCFFIGGQKIYSLITHFIQVQIIYSKVFKYFWREDAILPQQYFCSPGGSFSLIFFWTWEGYLVPSQKKFPSPHTPLPGIFIKIFGIKRVEL